MRNGSEILKVVDVYLNRSGHTALVDCVVVEAGRSQSFFVQLSQKDRQITVRLLPATDPEKTIGVKRVMALIAKQLHESHCRKPLWEDQPAGVLAVSGSCAQVAVRMSAAQSAER